MHATHEGCGILGTACHFSFVAATFDAGRAASHLVAYETSDEGFALDVVAGASRQVLYGGIVDVGEDADAIGRGERKREVVDGKAPAVESAAIARRTGADGREVGARHVDVCRQQGIGIAIACIDQSRELAKVFGRGDEVSAVSIGIDGVC